MSEGALAQGMSVLGRVPGVAFVLVALIAVFASMSPGFSTAPNLTNILVQSSILLLLALPMTYKMGSSIDSDHSPSADPQCSMVAFLPT